MNGDFIPEYGNNTLFSQPELDYLNYLQTVQNMITGWKSAIDTRMVYCRLILMKQYISTTTLSYCVCWYCFAIKISDELCTLNPVDPIQP